MWQVPPMPLSCTITGSCSRTMRLRCPAARARPALRRRIVRCQYLVPARLGVPGRKAWGSHRGNPLAVGLSRAYMVRVLKEDGKLNLLKGLITVEGSCSLGASRNSRQQTSITSRTWSSRVTTRCSVPQCQDTVDAINARRAAGKEPPRRTTLRWTTRQYNGKFNGVTHMMMDGTNNLEVMDVILDWANKYIENPPSTGKCNSPPPPAT